MYSMSVLFIVVVAAIFEYLFDEMAMEKIMRSFTFHGIVLVMLLM